MVKSQSIKIFGPGDVRIVDAPTPRPEPGHALLRLLYGGICGSDLGSYRGTFAYFEYPRIPGHEFSAEIVDIEEDNPYHLKKGMIVTCNPYFNCGQCYACRTGHVNCCTDNQTLGCQRDGAFSTYVSMPLDRIYDGNGLDPRVLSVIEPFCISFHGVKRAKIAAGEQVLVVGAGTIGILAAVAAKQFGAEVTVCDIAPGKLALAEQFGVDHVFLNSSDEEFARNVAELTGGSGFAVTVEAVGMPATFQNCIDAVAFSGRVVLIGVSKETLDFNFTMIQKKELNVYGSRNAMRSDFLETIAMVREGKLDLSRIITNEYAFADAARAFADFSANNGNMLKVLLRF